MLVTEYIIVNPRNCKLRACQPALSLSIVSDTEINHGKTFSLTLCFSSHPLRTPGRRPINSDPTTLSRLHTHHRQCVPSTDQRQPTSLSLSLAYHHQSFTNLIVEGSHQHTSSGEGLNPVDIWSPPRGVISFGKAK